MATTEFVFTLEFSSDGASASLLEDLASQVLGHVGCSNEMVSELTDALEQALATGVVGPDRQCDVQFRASGGTLEILVTSGGGRLWHASRTIP